MNPAPDAWPVPPLPEAALSAWLAQSHDLLVLADAGGRIAWCNPAFQQAFGSAAPLGLPLPALLTADARAGTGAEAVARAFGDHPDHDAGDLALQLATASGKCLAVRARTWRVGDQTLWTLLDVTEHRQTCTALRRAAERTALIAGSAGIGTWSVDFDGTSEHWDEQMFLLRGLPPQGPTPSHEQRVAMVHPADRARVRKASPESAATTGVLAYEFRVRLPDGGYRWLASRSVPVFDSGGRLLHRVGVNWDATESKRVAAAEQQAVLGKRERQAQLALFARVSHELRTPLNAVLGFTQLLQREAAKSGADDRLSKLEHIRMAGEQLLALTSDVLAQSSRERAPPTADDTAAAAPSAPAAATAPTSAPGRAGRILYIEDNPINVMLVEQMVLTLPGLELHAEDTGQAGVMRARQLQPDLILVDLQLPDFDGFEVLRRLRAQTETAATRCIALSANAMPDDIARGLQAGFADYWTKPIDFKSFLADLEALFPTR